MPLEGQALTIIRQNEMTKNFELDEAALASVLLRADVRDKPVCVVAVAGAFRKGKSFLLNYFLRYCASQREENWTGSPSDPLKGFSWRKSSQRETTGILVWSEPFFVKIKSGEEIAILLMDTQGTFDTESSLEESTVVFALTVLVSSVVVYNLKDQIQENDLMDLSTFTQYGLLAREKKYGATGFQKILFLIRDWINTEDFAYGAQGGLQYLETILKIKPNQKQAHQDLRHNLRKCFSDIGCYLMPRPGDAAVTDKKFDGSHSELDDEFVKHLKELVPRLFAPENIEKKTLAGQTIKAEDLFNNFKIYMEAFNSKDLPELTSVADSMANARCAVVARKAKESYDNDVKKSVNNDSILDKEDLEDLHSTLYQSALEYYRSRCYGINKRISSSYERQLIEELASLHMHFVENNAKNAEIKAARCAVVAKEAKESYDNGMKKSVNNDRVLGEEDLKALHSTLYRSALEYYRSRCCGINEKISSSYERQLIEELASLHMHFVEKNTKNAEIKAAKAEAESKERCAVVAKEAKESYDNGMKKSVNNDRVLGEKNLKALHSTHYQSALEYYRSQCRGINARISSSYEQQLKEDLTSLQAQFVKANTKNSEMLKYRKEIENTKMKLAKSKTKKYLFNRVLTRVTAAAATAVGATVGAVAALPAAAIVGAAAGEGGFPLGFQSLMRHITSRKSKLITQGEKEA